MTHPTILVTGATGRTGRPVVEQLLAQGWPVRALVHRIDARSDALARAGAEVVVADMFDPDQLLNALRGVQRAYYLTLFRPYLLQAATAFATAAREARLEVLVQMSQWTSHRAHPAFLTRETWLADQLFSMLPHTGHIILNPGMFADNDLRLIDMASLLGVFPVLTGQGRSAPVANEDIARTAVALLQRPDGHVGRRVRPTGPKLLDGREKAAALATALGRSVRAVDLPLWMFLKSARLTGGELYEVSSYVQYLRDYEAGTFSFAGGVTDVVRELTGTPAEPFETTAARYAQLPQAQRSAGNLLRALAKFMVTPFVPGYDLADYERRMGFPRPASPSLSVQDERWRREHAQQMGLPVEGAVL